MENAIVPVGVFFCYRLYRAVQLCCGAPFVACTAIGPNSVVAQGTERTSERGKERCTGNRKLVK